jgi:hypothetical protein
MLLGTMLQRAVAEQDEHVLLLAQDGGSRAQFGHVEGTRGEGWQAACGNTTGIPRGIRRQDQRGDLAGGAAGGPHRFGRITADRFCPCGGAHPVRHGFGDVCVAMASGGAKPA